MPTSSYYRTKKVKKVLDELMPLEGKCKELEDRFGRIEVGSKSFRSDAKKVLDELTPLAKKCEELENSIVRVTAGSKSFKRDVYMTSDELKNVKNLKYSDLDGKGDRHEFVGGRLPMMAKDGVIQTHHKKTSEIGQEVCKLLMGEHEDE